MTECQPQNDGAARSSSACWCLLWHPWLNVSFWSQDGLLVLDVLNLGGCLQKYLGMWQTESTFQWAVLSGVVSEQEQHDADKEHANSNSANSAGVGSQVFTQRSGISASGAAKVGKNSDILKTGQVQHMALLSTLASRNGTKHQSGWDS